MVSDEQIRLTVADALGVDAAKLDPETPLNTIADFDSVQVLTLMLALDEAGVKLLPNDVGKVRTFGDILVLVRK